jgi:threonine dehydratase
MRHYRNVLPFETTCMSADGFRLPTFADVETAARRLSGVAVKTPLLRAPILDELTGARVLLKAESLQRTGSFKFRGAYNRISQFTPDQRKGGVVAWSSGNHAQGVAAAAALLGVRATIVMPRDAPAIKIANTKSLGAEIVLYDRATEVREAIGRDIAAKHGAVVVPPYDDADVIAGQGTAGLEAAEQARARGLTIDDVIAPASGGGLIGGVGLAIKHFNPNARIYTAEPAHYDDHRRSVADARPQRNASAAAALCDALLAPTPGELTWALNRTALSGGYAVADQDVRRAVAFAFQSLKLVLEPSGAIALAVLLDGQHAAKGRTVALILSGGNIDSATFTACLTSD